MRRRSNLMLVALACAIAAAVAIPAALAAGGSSIYPDDRAGTHGAGTAQTLSTSSFQGSSIYPDDRRGVRGAGSSAALSFASTSGSATYPDDRTGVRGAGGEAASGSAVYPDDRTGARGIGPATIVIAPSSGFDWGDAGIGAVGGVGMTLLFAGALILLTRRQQKSKDRGVVAF